MAKSKTGGSRGFLRGRIASDVYSIGKDGTGKKQQVVRSLAESVRNPQTLAQMRGRMIMSTIMQAVSAMSEIIDHSFDNVPTGQPSISEFIRRNYALIKADVAAHPSEGNTFALNEYKEKGLRAGAYQISQGSGSFLPAGSAVIRKGGDYYGVLLGLQANDTVGSFLSRNGFGDDDYLTICVSGRDTFLFSRFRVNTQLAKDTIITADNYQNIFVTEGNKVGVISLDDDAFANAANIVLTFAQVRETNSGVIQSQKVADGGYKHSTCVLAVPTPAGTAADIALPTYPVGDAMFLNGGEL